MRRRYLVADQNYLRAPELEALLTTDPSVRVIFPDLGFLEMAKGEQQELTVRHSLRILAKFPSRVKLARSVGQALRHELDTKRAVAGLIAPRASTKIVREVLACLATDPDTTAVKRLLDQPAEYITWLKHIFLDHVDNKDRALLLVEATRHDTGADFVKQVRSGQASFEERVNFVAERVPSMLLSVLVEDRFGFSAEKAKVFVRRKPLLLRYFYLNVWAALDWEEMGRLEGLSPEKVSNDYLDREYIIAATYFDGLLTKDTRMNTAYEALTQLLQRRV